MVELLGLVIIDKITKEILYYEYFKLDDTKSMIKKINKFSTMNSVECSKVILCNKYGNEIQEYCQ